MHVFHLPVARWAWYQLRKICKISYQFKFFNWNMQSLIRMKNVIWSFALVKFVHNARKLINDLDTSVVSFTPACVSDILIKLHHHYTNVMFIYTIKNYLICIYIYIYNIYIDNDKQINSLILFSKTLIWIFTRGQFWPSGIVIASVCPSIISLSVR